MKLSVPGRLTRAEIYLEFVKFLNWIKPDFPSGKCLTSIFQFAELAEIAKGFIRDF